MFSRALQQIAFLKTLRGTLVEESFLGKFLAVVLLRMIYMTSVFLG